MSDRIKEYKDHLDLLRMMDQFGITARLFEAAVADLEALQLKPSKCEDPEGCKDKTQCWEPCGELGKDEEYVAIASEEIEEQVNEIVSAHKIRRAMVNFCEKNAGEIKYVPEFNSDGICTVVALTNRRLKEMREEKEG